MDSLAVVEVTIPAGDGEFEERVEALLWDAGAQGIERHDAETWSELVEDPRPLKPGTIRWRLYRDGATPLTEAVTQVVAVLPDDPRIALDAWVLTDLSFLTEWKKFFHPTRVSPRILVCPPWDIPDVEPGVVRVVIEPGMAFGTGTHETTRLCLLALDRVGVGPDSTVLDVGTGSGILAIAAALLGAARSVGIDNDPLAVAVAAENLVVNGVVDRVEVSADDLDDVPGSFDVVLANILPHVLIDLRDALWSRVAPGGALILGGILHTEAQRVVDAFGEVAGPHAALDRQNDWTSITWRR